MKKRHEKTKSAYKQKPPRDNSEAVLRYSIFQRQFTPVDSAPTVLHPAPETAKLKFRDKNKHYIFKMVEDCHKSLCFCAVMLYFVIKIRLP